jgi:hypothetical protein
VFSDVREHNLRKTGRSRKEWIFYDLANTVWGNRPVASKTTHDTDPSASVNMVSIYWLLLSTTVSSCSIFLYFPQSIIPFPLVYFVTYFCKTCRFNILG